ncbi:MAG: hypothetical protein AAFQ83_03355 [Bacteroidota bacterium]
MSKKFTTKKLRLRARAKRRRFALKTNPQTTGIQSTPELENLEVIRSLDSKVKAIQAQQN